MPAARGTPWCDLPNAHAGFAAQLYALAPSPRQFARVAEADLALDGANAGPGFRG